MASKAGKRRERQAIVERVQVVTPQRAAQPEEIVAHVGPTNSGKSFDALQALAERGAGTYAAPLRMLAQEAYLSLCDLIGADKVGLRTGEERINPDAPVLCCTTEVAPMQGDLLVVDEAHWAAEEARGWAWTSLLAAAEYRSLRIISSNDALPLLHRIFGQDLQVRHHQRLGDLSWAGTIDISDLRRGDVVVAFSRRSVLHLGGMLASQRGQEKVAVLYGAMPADSRRDQLQRLRDGRAEICVCTDVIGHGLNLPVSRIVFAETAKFDGNERRSLLPWEVAQIAGRAGRYGLAGSGEVGILSGSPWYRPSPTTAQTGMAPSVLVSEGVRGFSFIDYAWVRPRLEDLQVSQSDQLLHALRGWSKQAQVALADHLWMRPASLQALIDRVGVVQAALGAEQDRLTTEQVWALGHSPCDAEDENDRQILTAMTQELAGHNGKLRWFGVQGQNYADLASAELSARRAAQLRWFVNRFEPGSLDPKQTALLEVRAAEQVLRQLRKTLAKRQVGRCQDCGAECAPWHRYCDFCV